MDTRPEKYMSPGMTTIIIVSPFPLPSCADLIHVSNFVLFVS
jgi:hypothetical protein